MSKFRVNEIVWVQVLQEQGAPTLSPGIIRTVCFKRDPLKYEVSFIDEQIEQDKVILSEDHLKNFLDIPFDENEASKSQIASYKIALSAHKRFQESQPFVKPPGESKYQWTPNQLKIFLRAVQSAEEIGHSELRRSIQAIDEFKVQKEHFLVYQKENFSQLINYLVNECEINPSLKVSLERLNKKIIATVIATFIDDGSILKSKQ